MLRCCGDDSCCILRSAVLLALQQRCNRCRRPSKPERGACTKTGNLRVDEASWRVKLQDAGRLQGIFKQGCLESYVYTILGPNLVLSGSSACCRLHGVVGSNYLRNKCKHQTHLVEGCAAHAASCEPLRPHPVDCACRLACPTPPCNLQSNAHNHGMQSTPEIAALLVKTAQCCGQSMLENAWLSQA